MKNSSLSNNEYDDSDEYDDSKSIKIITYEETKCKHNKNKQTNNKTEKIKKKRIITSSNKWNFTESELSLENQANFINSLETSDPSSCSIFLQQVSQKIYNYKTQDIEKNLYSPDEFVTTDHVLNLLKKKPFCFYCESPVFIFYEYVREPKQWTLERIDNSRGHNCDNVEIACLTCNLRRRTMHYERFLFTKQVKFKKVL